jgi:hypothetical protein
MGFFLFSKQTLKRAIYAPRKTRSIEFFTLSSDLLFFRHINKQLKLPDIIIFLKLFHPFQTFFFQYYHNQYLFESELDNGKLDKKMYYLL